MVGFGHSHWLMRGERAWLERRVGSLGWHNYNNFMFSAETHFIVKYSHIGYYNQFMRVQIAAHYHFVMKNVTFEELPGERLCPPERIYYIESHLFILGKSFWSSVFSFSFSSLIRRSKAFVPASRFFPCNRAVCLSPSLPALLLGVSARLLLLVVMRERKWRREKRVKQRRTFRHWQPRRGTVWPGSTGRNSTPRAVT